MERQSELLKDFLEKWYEEEGIDIRTSGSTGTPKLIHLSHRQLLCSALRTNRFFRLNRNSHIHSAVSFEFIGGKMMIARSLAAGCTLTYSSPSLYPELRDEFDKIDLISVVPAQFPYILENLDQFSRIRNFLVGGTAISDSLWDKIVASGLNVWESYAMTETASHIALRRVAGNSGCRPNFVPLPGIKIRLNEHQCLVIVDNGHEVITNDMAEIKHDGNFVILGRRDDVINTGGIKVFPQDLENKLSPYIGSLCKEFMVSSEPDEIWTSRIILKIVPKDDAEDKHELAGRIRDILEGIPEAVLARKLKPKAIHILDEIPRTPTGKILRR